MIENPRFLASSTIFEPETANSTGTTPFSTSPLAANIANMPSHAIYAIRNANNILGEKCNLDIALGDKIRNQFKAIDEKKLKHRLNSFLPADIAVFHVFKVKQDAHARFHAVSRSYQYRISMEKNVFLSHMTLQLMQTELDVEKMNEAAQLLIKHEDFKCFSRSKTDVKTYLCDISEAFWKWEGKELIFQISANRFLRNMVRAVVGTLLEVGKHKMSISEFENVIKSRDRTRAGASVKAKGLFLTKVDYPDEIFNIS